MLRRNSSRNKQRRPLSRSKSTSSIVQNPVDKLESIDPVTAQRDAHLAAVLSFNRAQGKESVDMSAMPRDSASFVSDGNETAGQTWQRLRRSDSVNSRIGGSEIGPGIKRQQSIRFAGPSARPRRALAARTSEHRPKSATPASRYNVLETIENRPASTLSYVKETPESNSFTRRYLRSLRGPEYFVADDETVSDRNSPRELRHSRSMVAPTDPSSQSYYFDNNNTPTQKSQIDSCYALTNKENEPLGQQISSTTPELRAPKSMSFLRNRQERVVSTSSSRAENDLAVQLARDKFREQIEQQSRLKSHPSMFLRTRQKRSESSAGFRKSLRNSSNNSTVLSSAFTGDSITVPKQGSLRKTARKVSRTLKTRLKGLFTKPKSIETSEDLVQDLGTHHESDGESCLHMPDPPSPEEASMFRVSSHMPSLHAVPPNQQMRSRQGSLESAASGEDHQFADDRSRVTSWSNSITNTISSQETSGDWERPRLSVIKENGAHVSSSSYRSITGDTIVEGQIPRMTVDSQRVYLALMKRVEEAKQRDNLAGLEDRNATSQGLATSFEDTAIHRRSASTIRRVRENDDVFQDRAVATELRASSSCDSLIKHPRASESTMSSTPYNEDPNKVGGNESASLRKKTSSKIGRIHGPTPISHRSSAFFASPTCHMFRTTSPFRRALQENIKAAKGDDQKKMAESKYLSSLSALSLPMRQPSSIGSDLDPRVAYTESVYSSITEEGKSGHVKENTTVVERFSQPPRVRNHGDVTIFIDKPSYNPSPTHKRDISTASSVEWKTWLSANVSKLETPISSPRVGA